MKAGFGAAAALAQQLCLLSLWGAEEALNASRFRLAAAAAMDRSLE